jgi:hypothetical protein
VHEAINTVLANNAFVEYIHTNVGRYGVEVIKRLAVPKTDNVLANELSVKVKEVRRVLNLLSGYGITKYDTEKDSKGLAYVQLVCGLLFTPLFTKVKIDVPNWPQKGSWIGVFLEEG